MSRLIDVSIPQMILAGKCAGGDLFAHKETQLALLNEYIQALCSVGVTRFLVAQEFDVSALPPQAKYLHTLPEENTLSMRRNETFTATALACEDYNTGLIVCASFCGIGGYAPLEEVLLALHCLYDTPHAENYAPLQIAARAFSQLTGKEIPPMKPMLGSAIFAYESGIHADGIAKNPRTYEPYLPELVGKQRQLYIGKHSGKQAVIRKLEELGVHCSAQQAQVLLGAIKTKSTLLGRSLTDAELIELQKENRS